RSRRRSAPGTRSGGAGGSPRGSLPSQRAGSAQEAWALAASVEQLASAQPPDNVLGETDVAMYPRGHGELVPFQLFVPSSPSLNELFGYDHPGSAISPEKLERH